MIEGRSPTQFETIAAAAQGCDVIVGATALQIAAPSIAEKMGIPYVFAAYCPAVLPSRASRAAGAAAGAATSRRPDGRLQRALGEGCASAGTTCGCPAQRRIARRSASRRWSDVRSHVLTERPWLAADPTLAPWPDAADEPVFQTGAWILPDERPLSDELETFLDAGDAPIYFGFGSIRATADLAPRDDRVGARARPASDPVARMGRARAAGRRARLPGDR